MTFYQLQDLGRACLAPFTHVAELNARLFSEPSSWLSHLPGARRFAAGSELFFQLGKVYPKPAWNITSVEVGGAAHSVVEETSLAKPFCRLVHFDRITATGVRPVGQPRVLVVAPLSGHYATLLRDTVATLLRDHEVYVTDWVDAREVPTTAGTFSLDDYVAYVETFIRHLGADALHVMAVCQPTVPVLAAVSLMAARGEPTPRSLTLMGGPVDARRSPTQVNDLATQHPISWFEHNLVHAVPQPYAGHGRRVYPGFLQLASFIAMNPRRHAESHWDFYLHLVQGDLEDADAHRRFYDEYNAVLDMDGAYYLDTVRVVFQEFLLARGQWKVAGELVTPSAIAKTALMSIEGELDDISGSGQTEAAHALCSGLAAEMHTHYVVPEAGHYGIFSGRRWREQVYPQLRSFIAQHGG